MKSVTRRTFIKAGGVAAATCAAWAADSRSTTRGEGREKGCTQKKNVPYPFELGVASYTFREFNLDAALAMTRRVGLGRICLKDVHLPLQSSAADIAAAVAKVRGAGLVPYGCGVIYMTSPEEVERAFAYAAAAGMTVIIGVPDYKLLALAERKVRETGIRLAIHNHGPDNPLYPSPQSVFDQVKDLDPRLGLCLDVGHCQRLGIDPSEAVEACAGRILDLHLKDVTAPTKAGGPVEAGRGVVDIPRLLRTLIKIDYSGSASFEFEKDGKDPLPGLAESVGFVRGALAARGSA